MQELQHIGSIKDLRPQNTLSTNIYSPLWLMFELGFCSLMIKFLHMVIKIQNKNQLKSRCIFQFF